MRVIAVIPAYNEAGRIAETVRNVRRKVDAVVVVDDGSVDTTAASVSVGDVVVLRHAVNRGQGAALRTGTEAALRLGAEIIVHVDADGQHDPTCIPMLLEPLRDGTADVVFGSRFLELKPIGMPMSRRLLHTGIKLFNAFVMGIPRRLTDPQSGMRAMTAEAARRIDFCQDRMAHCSEILRLVTHSDLRMCEVPVRIHYTTESLAKGQKSLDAFKIVWQLFLGVFR